MSKYLFPAALACLLLAASCTKDDDQTPAPEPQTSSVNGYFSIQYDSTKTKIDSMRTYFLNAKGILDSATSVGKYSWQSPVRIYRSGDSAYASVMAFGVAPAGNGAAPLKFSEPIQALRFFNTSNSFIQGSKAGFVATYGFRLK